MKMTPKSAGITKLITHRMELAVKIPTVLAETVPRKYMAKEPLTPNSVMAMVGTTVIVRYVSEINIKPVK